MALRLIVTHGGASFEPPVKAGVKVEWERTGVPGKLTFSVIRLEGQSYAEGDVVSLWYDGKPVFRGYIFTIKRSRDEQIDITCYDQLRYFKNKYTYVFENRTAAQIIKALCDDYSLAVGTLDSTGYVIPLLAEENKSAFDIALSALQDTLTNTGKMFVLYDDFGKLCVRDAANMVSDSVIMETSAEDYDYTSTIDEETYNNVILYYKEEDNRISLYAASSPSTIKQWGTLRYFEEVRNKTIAANKAKSLLALYNRKKRSLTVKKAFGSVSVRGGTLIPVMLNLGDRTVKNYMLVQKVVHRFDDEHYTMDLTLDGAWDDPETDVVTAAYEAPAPKKEDADSGSSGGITPTPSTPKKSTGKADSSGETWKWPAPSYSRISSKFGWRSWSNSFHKGIDLAAPSGSNIVASKSGTVITNSYNAGGYGNYIIIDHGGGYKSVYAHLSRSYVRVGQNVTRGQVIGLCGSTGRSTGPHLHFEIRVNNTAKDPLNYL